MKKPSRRHDSLIPLSREHQYALLLCLHIHKGVREQRAELTWLQKKATDAVQFFESDLTLHFKAEEESLFPAMRDWPDASRLISELLNEHRELERSIEQLRETGNASLAERLNEFADLLEAHIRKEERILFPLYEKEVSPEIARQVGQRIIDTIGLALQPRHPELLR